LDKATVTELNRRLLQNLRDNATDTAQHEAPIPAAAFTCPERFAREREHLFLEVPQPIAFSAEISTPGSYLPLDVLDVPVLLTRDEDGQLRAFINACSHRGAPVATDQGQARRLVCPFHGWTYHLNGQLAGRPGREYFTTAEADCALSTLPVSEKYGLVVLGLSSGVSQDKVETALDEIGPELASLQLASHQLVSRRQFNVKANWKLVNDLSLESYHFSTLHRNSVAEMLAPNAVVDIYARHSRWAFPLKSISGLAELDEEDWPDHLEGSCTYTLYPGVMIIINATGAQMIRSEPGASPGESRVVYAGIRQEDCDPLEARQAYEFGGEVFSGEDLPTAEQCQRGLAAGHRDILLGRNEPLLQFWHRLWAEAID